MQPSDTTPPSAATILVIDDQEDNLVLLDTVLSSRGFAVRTADGGAAGLALALAEPPDLILLDLAMPEMDGFEVLARLRQDRRTHRIPVIILTANYRDADMVERGLSLGATEYLTKPLQMEELIVRLRSALKLSATERELARLRRDFASMLVHDMRSPLEGIRLALSALKRQEDPSSNRLDLYEHALTALAGVGSLMDDLLQANRLEEEGFTPNTQPVVLGELLDISLKILGPIADARELSLVVERCDDLPPVLADPGLLRRVIDNLISNAIKFTDTGEVRISARQDGERLRVGIRDTGCGIPAEALSRVFDRYYHLARRQAHQQNSFGLGLAVCQRAIDAMQGEIGATSEEGHGSEFWFTLPLAPVEAASRA